MKIAFISSYIPRKCGIATYTRDLTNELKKQGHVIGIFAMENAAMNIQYTKDVVQKIHQNEAGEYEAVAEKLNRSDFDIIHIQHEFGLFGGDDGIYLLMLVHLLHKPFVITFHTILQNPSSNQKFIMQELSRQARGIVVMEPIAKDRLITIYDVAQSKIHMIYHGVPSIAGISKRTAKKKLGLEKTFVIMANNLIARNKGYEYVIQALPELIKKIPSLRFLIIGETHPLVKLSEGESYREELRTLASSLHMSKHVQFINQYISLDELRVYLSATDIYVTPYLDPEQITSGTLSYAIGVGKSCVSTPYIYAKKMLSDNRGILVPFRDSTAIEQAISNLYENTEKRNVIERNALLLGKKMHWDKVAQKHSILYKATMLETHKISALAKRLIRKKVNLNHLEFLTDNMGLLQHTHYAIPERRYGYSTDDNARALIIIASLYQKNPSTKLFQFMKLFISYLHLAQESNGKFHTFLNFQHNWIDTEDIADPYGKALWGLGYFLYTCPETVFTQSVDLMFQKSLHHSESITNLRTAAYMILGLYYYYKRYAGEKEFADIVLEKIKKVTAYLITYYQKNADDKWEWFESIVTYDNFRIPQALFAAYLITNDETYKRIAKNTIEFLYRANYNRELSCFDFIGQNGWYARGKEKAYYDQQPLEAAAAVDAFLFAYKATKQKRYITLAIGAFEWFIGRNRNKVSLIDSRTGGIFDGLTPRGINQNEGAESLVCFLIAQFNLKEILNKVAV